MSTFFAQLAVGACLARGFTGSANWAEWVIVVGYFVGVSYEAGKRSA